MEATKGPVAATKILVDRWGKVTKDLPAICLMAGEKNPFAVAIAAAAMILRAEVVIAKKAGTRFDIMAYAEELKKEVDEIEELPVEELVKKAMKATEEIEDESEDESDE